MPKAFAQYITMRWYTFVRDLKIIFSISHLVYYDTCEMEPFKKLDPENVSKKKKKSHQSSH